MAGGYGSTPHDDFEFDRLAREGRLSRRQLLARAGSAGLAASSLSGVLAAGAKAATTSSASAPKVGGTMVLGVTFGAASSLDPQVAPPGQEDTMRNANVFNLLYEFNKNAQVVPALAAEAQANAAATEWTIRLRSGVTFHDGSPLTADDVIYSLRRVIDPKTKSEDGASLTMLNPKGMHKVDHLTVRLSLNYPYAILPEQLASLKGTSIIKNGTTSFTKPNGTGPFMFVSQTANEVVLERNPHYWNHPLPYLDRFKMVNVQDPTALFNGVLSGTFDAIYPPASFSQAASVKNNSKVSVVYNKTGRFLPLSMDTAARPFSDSRARQALKIVADRPEMNLVAYGGTGYIGNDMFGYFDPGYPHDVPQRKYDPEQAASLWKAAGLDGQSVQIWVSSIWPGQVSSALAYSEQAKAAGITIDVKQTAPADYFTVAYGIKPYVDDYWGVYPILSLWSLEFLTTSPYYKICHYATAQTTKLYGEAVRQTNAAKRNELSGEIMRIFHDDGPYVLWAFEDDADIYSSRIGGAESNATFSLNGYHLENYYIRS